MALPATCIGMAFVSLYGIQIETDSLYAHRFHSASFLMLPAFSALAAFTLFRIFVPWGAPVRISPAGFIDLRAGSRMIPWSEVSNVVRRGEYVTLTLKRKFAKSYKMSLTQKAIKARRKSAGPSHLLIADWCLEASPQELLEIISKYRDENTGTAR